MTILEQEAQSSSRDCKDNQAIYKCNEPTANDITGEIPRYERDEPFEFGKRILEDPASVWDHNAW